MKTPTSGSHNFRVSPKWGGICSKCRSDLTIRTRLDKRTRSKQNSNGRIYCSNRACLHFTHPHPTGWKLNRGGLLP